MNHFTVLPSCLGHHRIWITPSSELQVSACRFSFKYNMIRVKINCPIFMKLSINGMLCELVIWERHQRLSMQDRDIVQWQRSVSHIILNSHFFSYIRSFLFLFSFPCLLCSSFPSCRPGIPIYLLWLLFSSSFVFSPNYCKDNPVNDSIWLLQFGTVAVWTHSDVRPSFGAARRRKQWSRSSTVKEEWPVVGGSGGGGGWGGGGMKQKADVCL